MTQVKTKTFSVTKIFLTVVSISCASSLAALAIFSYGLPVTRVKAVTAYKEVGGQKEQLVNYSVQTDNKLRIVPIGQEVLDGSEKNIGAVGKAVAISGQVELQNQQSYARAVLKTVEGDELLIAEISYPDTGTVSFDQLCEETCALDFTSMDKVEFQVYEADLQIDGITYLPVTGRLKTEVSQAELRERQVNETVSKINQKNLEKKQYWLADLTEPAQLSYAERKELVGGVNPPASAIFYYAGGYFPLGEIDESQPASTSAGESGDPFVFDWRDQHGQDYMTPVRTQGCGDCWAHSAVGAVEGVVNLYYNQQIEKNLSEQDLVSCGSGSCGGGFAFEGLDYIKDTGVVDETCFPYEGYDAPCSNKCGDWENQTWKIASQTQEQSDIEVKQALLNKGPLAFSKGYMQGGHAMVLAGFGEIAAGNYYGDDLYSTINIPSSDPLVGTTYWLVKNSWGIGWGEAGYGKFVIPDQDFAEAKFYSVGNPITQPNSTSYTINCQDEDEDGYCWWGIASDKPAGCPVSCSGNDLADCDDTNGSINDCPADYICGNHQLLPGGESDPFGGYTVLGQVACCGDSPGEYPTNNQACCNAPGMGTTAVLSYVYSSKFSGDFDIPAGLAVDENYVYHADKNNSRIQIFDHEGNLINQFGSSGSGDGQFNQPNGIDVNDNRILVADTRNHRIQVFDKAGNFVAKFGTNGSGNGEFSYPDDLAVSNDRIFVADSINFRVQILEIDANDNIEYISKFGSGPGSGDGEFNRPVGIAADSEQIYVADFFNYRVQIFDKGSNYLDEFGTYGTDDGQFNGPQAITVDDQIVYVVDNNNNRVQVFDTSGQFLDKFGAAGSGNGEFSGPTDVAAINNKIFVSDAVNNRIQVFDNQISWRCVEGQTCVDGTLYGQCSETKPRFCQGGQLVDNCRTCGCPANYSCKEAGNCQRIKDRPIQAIPQL